MSRVSKERYFTEIASLVSSRGTCCRRKVGCVLIDKLGHILATGYNGVPKGFPHCIDDKCLGANSRSGKNLDKCEAIHAEQNALLQCFDTQKIDTAFCTDSPCIHCVKLFLNTSCKRIVFLREYPHEQVKSLWERSGRDWVQLEEFPSTE